MTAPVLAFEEILSSLPYGRDFLFVNRVCGLEPERWITTSMDYERSSAILESHFRGGPAIVPGVVLAEQVCQSALLLGLLSKKVKPGQPLLLGRLQCRFIKPALADCTIHSRVDLVVAKGDSIGFIGDARLNGDSIAQFQGSAKSSQGEG